MTASDVGGYGAPTDGHDEHTVCYPLRTPPANGRAHEEWAVMAHECVRQRLELLAAKTHRRMGLTPHPRVVWPQPWLGR